MMSKFQFIILFFSLILTLCCAPEMESRQEISKFRVLGLQTTPPEAKLGEKIIIKALFSLPEGKSGESAFILPDFEASLQKGEFVPLVLLSPIDEEGLAQITFEGFANSLFASFDNIDAPEEVAAFIQTLNVFNLGCVDGKINTEVLANAAIQITQLPQLEVLSKACEGSNVSTIITHKSIKTDVFGATEKECNFFERNTNPVIEELLIDDIAISPDEIPTIYCEGEDGCREFLSFKLNLTKQSHQFYCTWDHLQDSLVVRNEIERSFVSWYSDDGKFEQARIRSDSSLKARNLTLKPEDIDTDEPLLYFEDLEKGPHYYFMDWRPPREGGFVNFWMVVSDLRGGIGWQQYSIFIEHEAEQ